MSQLFFVSTGRCGTKRIAEILKEHLPEEEFDIQHQMDISRLANIAGNIMYHFGSWEWLKKNIYNHIIKKYANKENFICSDPLVAMIIPEYAAKDPDTHIVHITREQKAFAESFYRFTRKRFLSFFAHNFIPFWQIGIWPLENILNPNIEKKYQSVWKKKNDWLKAKYKTNPNYLEISLDEIFLKDKLNSIIQDAFNNQINIPETELRVKTNQTVAK